MLRSIASASRRKYPCGPILNSPAVSLSIAWQGGSYEGDWRAGEREGVGIRTMRSGRVLAGQPVAALLSHSPCLWLWQLARNRHVS